MEARDGMTGVTSRWTVSSTARFHVGGSESLAKVSGAGQVLNSGLIDGAREGVGGCGGRSGGAAEEQSGDGEV